MAERDRETFRQGDSSALRAERRAQQRRRLRRQRLLAAGALALVAAGIVAIVVSSGGGASGRRARSGAARRGQPKAHGGDSSGKVRNATPQPDWSPYTGPVPILE